jgi:hypothetical protein
VTVRVAGAEVVAEFPAFVTVSFTVYERPEYAKA